MRLQLMLLQVLVFVLLRLGSTQLANSVYGLKVFAFILTFFLSLIKGTAFPQKMSSWKFKWYYVEIQKSAISFYFSWKKPLILRDHFLEMFPFSHFLAADDFWFIVSNKKYLTFKYEFWKINRNYQVFSNSSTLCCVLVVQYAYKTFMH